MAKIAYSKLGCKINEEKKTIVFNDQEIEILQYLPAQDKLALFGRIIELAHDEDKMYSNPVKIKIFRTLEIVFSYSNISFTEKQKEDLAKLYDQIISSGLWDAILNTIPEAEYSMVVSGLNDSIEAVYKYYNSVVGVLDTIATNYDNLNLDLDKIKEKIADPQLLSYVKDMLDKVN